jgi:hypothetical protein
MADRLELIQLLRIGKKMDRDIAYKIYGYAVTRPEFEEEALSLMERLYILYAAPEDRNPRELYREIMDNYHRERDAELKPVAHWFAGECEKQWEKSQEEGEEKRRIELMKRKRYLLKQKRRILMQKLTQ